MSKLVNLKLDLSKITKDKIFKGKKGSYIDLVVALNDNEDNYGNDVSCWEKQTDEEREQKIKNYLGNGKTFWTSEAKQEPATQSTDDDLPF